MTRQSFRGNKSPINRMRLLKAYLSKKKDVMLAFVFGSCAQNRQMRESDFDIAIYLSPRAMREKERDYRSEDEIRMNVGKIIGREVDFVVLNDASASLVSNVVKTGIPLVVKNRALYLDTYLRASTEAEDFSQFAKDYFEIYQKASSLVPEEQTRLLERLQFLDEELMEVDEFRKLTFKEYQEDKRERRNIERWAENIINACIDTAKIVLASEKKRLPKTYEEALYDFGIFAGLSRQDSKRLSKFADLRNILAHEYLDVLYRKIQDFVREFPRIYKEITKFRKKYLSR